MGRDMMRLRRGILLNTPHEESASGAVVSFKTDVSKLKECVVSIEPVQSGSGDPSPDNVRPISGWSAVNVTRTGKNLLAKSFSYRPLPSALSDCFFVKAGSYKFSFDSIAGATAWRIGVSLFDSAGNPLNASSYAPVKYVGYNSTVKMWWQSFDTSAKVYDVTIVKDCYIRIWFGGGNTNDTMTASEAQLELGSTATGYEAFAGNTYTIQLGDTVYGGTLDVLTGVLTVDRVGVDLGTLSYTIQSSASLAHDRFTARLPYKSKRETYWTKGICSCYPVTANVGQNANDNVCGAADQYVYIVDTDYTDKYVFKSAMSGQTFVYDLASPFTVQLTPTQLRALKGQNNLWSDAGDVRIEYWKHSEI